MQLSGYLKEYAHTAGAIVGPVDGGLTVGGERVVVGEGAGVPVCRQHDAFRLLRCDAADEVRARVLLPVVGLGGEMLSVNGVAECAQRRREPVAAALMRLCAQHARPEVGLRFHVGVGGIVVESGQDDGGFRGLRGGFLGAVAGREQNGRAQQNH